jgi:hypothetical protein
LKVLPQHLETCWNFRRFPVVDPRRDHRRRPHDGNESARTGGETQYPSSAGGEEAAMIRKLKSVGYRLYSRKINPKTGRRRNLGTFKTRAAAAKHERAVQYFKRH